MQFLTAPAANSFHRSNSRDEFLEIDSTGRNKFERTGYSTPISYTIAITYLFESEALERGWLAGNKCCLAACVIQRAEASSKNIFTGSVHKRMPKYFL